MKNFDHFSLNRTWNYKTFKVRGHSIIRDIFWPFSDPQTPTSTFPPYHLCDNFCFQKWVFLRVFHIFWRISLMLYCSLSLGHLIHILSKANFLKEFFEKLLLLLMLHHFQRDFLHIDWVSVSVRYCQIWNINLKV